MSNVAPFGSAFSSGFYATPPAGTIARAAKRRVLGTDGDYELATDSTGNLADAVDPIDEEIYWRLATVAGSYAGDLSAGSGVSFITVATSQSRISIANAVKLALEPMRQRGVVSAVNVTVDIATELGTTSARYRVDVQKTGLVR